MNGRLKQGLFPWGAPPGYLNQGGGKPKDPVSQDRAAHQTGSSNSTPRDNTHMRSLLEECMRRGSAQHARGGKLTLCGLGNILQNPFYIGLMHIKSTGKTYDGMSMNRSSQSPPGSEVQTAVRQ